MNRIRVQMFEVFNVAAKKHSRCIAFCQFSNGIPSASRYVTYTYTPNRGFFVNIALEGSLLQLCSWCV